MTKKEHSKALKAAWEQIRTGLGDLGSSLDHAREWVGDVAFIRLAKEFSAGEVIVACGIESAEELLGMVGRDGPGTPTPLPADEHDRALLSAVRAAHEAQMEALA